MQAMLLRKWCTETIVVTIVDKGLHSITKEKKNKSGNTEFNVHDDEKFEKTLGDLDDNDIIDNLGILDRTIEDATKQTAGIRGNKQKSSSHKKNNPDELAQKKRKKDNFKEGKYLFVKIN